MPHYFRSPSHGTHLLSLFSNATEAHCSSTSISRLLFDILQNGNVLVLKDVNQRPHFRDERSSVEYAKGFQFVHPKTTLFSAQLVLKF